MIKDCEYVNFVHKCATKSFDKKTQELKTSFRCKKADQIRFEEFLRVF